MFTGIIEETGKIKSIMKYGKNAKLIVSCKKVIEESKKGDSIAVNGICLTITEIGKDHLTFDVSFETIEKSGFRFLKTGDIVNLERALKLSDRLGGHILQGHVDTITKVTSIKRVGDSFLFSFKTPSRFCHLIVEKGSIGIDGISLTVASINESNFSVAVIPTTFEETNLKFKKPGNVVNIEFDIIGKYVEKMLKQMPK